MIQLQILAKKINDELNALLLTGSEPLLSTEKGSYKFFVVADTADYKRAEREGNNVTFYMNGNLRLTGSNVESTQAGSFNAIITTRLDILVPVFDGSDEEGNKELVESVRRVLDDYFSTNGDGEMTEGEGSNEKKYYYGWQYNIAVSGARANLPLVNDSFIFSIDITWYFIENGVSSKKILVQLQDMAEDVDGNRIYGVETVDYLTFGITRSSTQESDTPSDTNYGESKNVDLATVGGYYITMPLLQNSRYMYLFKLYAVGLLRIGYPIEMGIVIPHENVDTFVRSSKTVYIQDVRINSEGATNASISITFTEAME